MTGSPCESLNQNIIQILEHSPSSVKHFFPKNKQGYKIERFKILYTDLFFFESVRNFQEKENQYAPN